MLIKAIANEESLEGAEPSHELVELLDGDRELAFRLAGRGVKTLDDLGEQSVDELREIEPMDEKRAAALIMKARASWFAKASRGK